MKKTDYENLLNARREKEFMGDDVWFPISALNKMAIEVNWETEVFHRINFSYDQHESVIKLKNKFLCYQYHGGADFIDSFDKYVEAVLERINIPRDRHKSPDFHWHLPAPSNIFRIGEITPDLMKLKNSLEEFEENPESFSEKTLNKGGISLRRFSNIRLHEVTEDEKNEIRRQTPYTEYFDPGEGALPPEVVRVIKKKYNAERRKKQREIAARGGTVTIVSCKGMGVVEAPSGSLKELGYRYAKIILPDGTLIKPFPRGQGKNFSYYYAESGKINLEEFDFSLYETIEGDERESGRVALFGCRSGSPDSFVD